MVYNPADSCHTAQTNTIDCGVYLLKNAESFINDFIVGAAVPEGGGDKDKAAWEKVGKDWFTARQVEQKRQFIIALVSRLRIQWNHPLT